MLGVLGKYRLEQRLGGGGMAEVFLAAATGAEGFTRKVAIKRVLPGFSDNQAFAHMFISEARISSQLVHPNIVSVLDFDRDNDGRLFLVMELVDGKDLDGLNATGMLPYPLTIFIISEILRGLGHAHDLPVGTAARGVVHRDISPHNVLLSWSGAVKVSDFGIAKARAASEATASQFIKGKPAYMSPEQANGQPLDGRSDLFAVGIMLWEMLVGRRLFVAEDTRATLAAVLFGQIPRPRALRSDVPKDLERVTMKLLERDLAARYPTAEHALHDLLECADAPRAGRELLVATLAERFAGQAPVRQSVLRSGRDGKAPGSATPTPGGHAPPVAGALPSLGAVMNAPTSTSFRARRSGAKIALIAIGALAAGVATFAVVSAVKRDNPPAAIVDAAPAIDGHSASDSAPPFDATMVDAAVAVDAGTPIDAAVAISNQPIAKKYGSLQVTSEPICRVFVDSKELRDTPTGTIANVAVGLHQVRCVNADATPPLNLHQTVTIRENQLSKLHFDGTKKGP